eukprot:Gb_27795 [translate_table: standard]
MGGAGVGDISQSPARKPPPEREQASYLQASCRKRACHGSTYPEGTTSQQQEGAGRYWQSSGAYIHICMYVYVYVHVLIYNKANPLSSIDFLRSRANFNANANKEADSISQQCQADAIIVRAETKVEARAVWGNKQRRTNRKKNHSTLIVEETVVSCIDSIDSNATDGGLKTTSQRKVRKSRAQTLTATLTARSEDACKASEEPLPSIDEGDLENQLAVVEYVEDIYKFYRKTENLSCVPPDYMSRQVEINDKMRAILIDWLIEVHLKFELMPETLYLTTNIIDRYLSTQTVPRRKLQLVGLTAMLIACKYEEIWAPEINDFVCISAKEYSGEQIVAMTEHLAFFLTELCLIHYVMVKYTPSMLAAAAVYTAQCTLKKDPYWNITLTLHTGYSEADLRECAHFMVTFHLNAGGSRLKVIHKKYSDPILNSVALLSPASLPVEDSCSSSD